MGFLTEDLVNAIKLSEFFPNSQSTLDDPDDFISHANTEMQTKLVPMIDRSRQGFFASTKQVTLTDGLNRYALPERAFMNTFRDLWWMPDASKPWDKRPLPRVAPHNRDLHDAESGEPSGYMIEGDEIVILPTPGANMGAILFDYKERPNQIAATSTCAKITAVSTVGATTTFTVNTDLTGSLSAGSLVDFLSAKSPFRLWAKDVTISAITSTTIAVTAADVSNDVDAVEPIVGDYICPAQTTCIPMIPQEMHAILAELVCRRILKALGDHEAVAEVEKNVKEMIELMISETSQRVESSVEVIYDRHSILNQGVSAGASDFTD
jgi:hypothetical protein